MYNHKSYLIVLIFTLLALSLSLSQQNMLKTQSQSPNPLIIEYIPEFKVATNDLQKAIKDQLSKITISDVKTSYVTFTNYNFTINYLGKSKTVDNITNLKVKVINDSFSLSTSYLVSVKHLVSSKKYHCRSDISEVFITYIKQMNFQTNKILISQLNQTYSPKLFTTTCTEKQSSKDKTRIDEGVTALEGSSLYLQIKKILTFENYFNFNAEKEHLSQTYIDNPYVYSYYDFNIAINVATIGVNNFGEQGIENQISGAITNTTHTGDSTVIYINTYHTYYSWAFVQNMLEYSFYNYPNWKKVKVDSKIRSRVFKFRLIDLQYVIPNILITYPQLYMKNIQFECSIDNIGDFTITDVGFNQIIGWKCKGSLEVTPGSTLTFVQFAPSINYKVQLNLNGNTLSVYYRLDSLVSNKYTQISNFEIVDETLANIYISEAFNDLQGYSIGTYLKVREGSTKIGIYYQGIWIG